ncbi:MAG: TIGR00266 family protein [Leptospiraceae bacterium]|nr:TIGR00266 family protein [Leptospiraceae bacterium]
MKSEIVGAPAFASIHVELDPGETIIAESGAMASMEADLDMKAKLNGGFFRAPLKKFLGGESFFVNEFTNNSNKPARCTLVQATPGDIREIELNDETFCLQPGAYIASTPGLKLGIAWAGFASFIGREGLFKLEVSGTGKLYYGAYGAFVDKQLDGEYIVDTSHLVAYDPSIKLKMQLAGGIFSSFFGGEGLVTRLEGKGRVVLQTRSLSGMAGWINPFFWS